MAVTRESPIASRMSRIVLGATIACGLVAAVAAAPTAPVTKVQSSAAVKAAVSLNDDGLRPLARGPAIRVGRAYGAEDEDCTLILKPSTDERGRVRYLRSVICAN